MAQATASRRAQLSDAGDIARIYSEGIADRVATFETQPRTRADVEKVLRNLDVRHPAVVVEHDGRVVAFAWTSTYRPRACYDLIAEFSVYVGREARGTGCGREVLSALIEAAEAAGLHKLVSRVFPENTASRALCRAVGFREVGTYVRHGQLDGEWRDCVIVERLLGEAAR
ncbi:MAG TPA: arsinothricin resistance N-acetyltransferase ArsN1 family A [Candidatus Dormibacteraeota bacterium]